MRELALHELALVSGGEGQTCPKDNDFGGVSDTEGLGQDLINIYEGLVAAASHVIERVANAF
jgi:hypothetical protein